MNTLKGITGRSFTFSDEDHLLTAGTTSYQYDVDGFLTTKSAGTDVTTYDYSSRGELISVTLPDCIFRLIPATNSAPFRPPIPEHSGHLFRYISATL